MRYRQSLDRRAPGFGTLHGVASGMLGNRIEELLAPIAASHIFGTNVCRQRGRQGARTSSPTWMTVGVVDPLEIVDIEHDQRQGMPSRRARDTSRSSVSSR